MGSFHVRYDGRLAPHDVSALDLKKTVHLPKTDFPMKANLGQAEPKLLARWESPDFISAIRAGARRASPPTSCTTGRPTPTATSTWDTAFNKLLKDFIVKSKTMEGFDSPYVPGWDCHGLPIEHKVESELGKRKAHDVAGRDPRGLPQVCGQIRRSPAQGFHAAGVFGRWEDPYLTMSAEYEAVIASAFVDFLDKGYVYKGLKPVNWCIYDRTALAEAEVEYENHISPSIWVRFALTSDPAVDRSGAGGQAVYA